MTTRKPRKPRKPRDLYTRLGLTPPDWYAAVNRPDLRPLPLPCAHSELEGGAL